MDAAETAAAAVTLFADVIVRDKRGVLPTTSSK